jgi:hypothetical protein
MKGYQLQLDQNKTYKITVNANFPIQLRANSQFGQTVNHNGNQWNYRPAQSGVYMIAVVGNTGGLGQFQIQITEH